MVFRRFTFLTVIRVVLILVNGLLLSYILGRQDLFFNQLILGTILLVQIWELFRFINVTNRELQKFFHAIRQSDFTISFTKDHLGKSFRDLFEEMRLIIQAYDKVTIEREAQFHLLQRIISNVSVGIIVVSEEREITLINEASREILGLPNIKTWKGIEAKLPSFTEEVGKLPESGSFLVRLKVGGEKVDLTLHKTQFSLLDKSQLLLTFSDIKSAVERTEIEAWHKLIRILTHEIMNSITPVSSLSETIQLVLQESEGKPKPIAAVTQNNIDDVLTSSRTIQRRSDGLLRFVEDYRKITRVPDPDPAAVDVASFLSGVKDLMEPQATQQNIQVSTHCEKDLQMQFDADQIEQIIINLVKNSIEAINEEGKQDPWITLSATVDHTSGYIRVADSGPGIDDNDLENIWVPFFTTKESGSGIGLSLARQVMTLHSGKIHVHRNQELATEFVLEFPAKPNSPES